MILQTVIAGGIVLAAVIWLVSRYFRRPAAAASAGCAPCAAGGSSGGGCGSCATGDRSAPQPGLITTETVRNGAVRKSQL